MPRPVPRLLGSGQVGQLPLDLIKHSLEPREEPGPLVPHIGEEGVGGDCQPVYPRSAPRVLPVSPFHEGTTNSDTASSTSRQIRLA